MIARMEIYPDLVAYDAKYHKSCYSHYISERNIDAAHQHKDYTAKECKPSTKHDEAFKCVIECINRNVLSKRAEVVTSLQLDSVYRKALTQSEGDEDGNEETNRFWNCRIRDHLKCHFKNKIEFIWRQGLSTMICPSNLELGEVLQKVERLKSDLEEENEASYEDIPKIHPSGKCPSEPAHVLYQAAAVMRDMIEKVPLPKDCYWISSDVSKERCADMVPNLMYFFSWIIDTKSFTDFSVSDENNNCKQNLKIISLFHCILPLSKASYTPVTLALALTLHHHTGSSQLIEILNSLGMCVSYDEVRRFETCIAKEELNKAQDVYILDGIQKPNKVTGIAPVHATITLIKMRIPLVVKARPMLWPQFFTKRISVESCRECH